MTEPPEKTLPGRRERRKEKTRQEIVRAAMGLFERQGFEATSMEQIAEEADVAKGTLYNHFPAKEAIIGAYMRETVRELEPELGRLLAEHADVRSRMGGMAERMAAWAGMHRDLVARHIRYRMASAPRAEDRHRTGFERLVEGVIQSGQETGEIRGDLPASFLTRALYALFSISVVNWIAGHDDLSLEKALFRDIDLFLGGAAPGSGSVAPDPVGGGGAHA
ncbi:MAG: TetR/AcrR family transcriptional regulator [Syntrophobacteraceae bacterium]